ncbi:MAG: mechanosensitive ion channel family protein [Firmicutes bacterium]|nr:mechanosensitive ion channel family protein [Bacillota bacterium]
MDWTTLGPTLVQAGLKLLGGILILVIGLLIIKWIKHLLKKSKLFAKMEPTMAGFLKNLIHVLLLAIVILSAAGVMGVPLSLFVTLVSLVGAAITLAVQGVLSNFIGGVVILILKPFKAGQYIKVGDIDGTVKQIGMYYTILVTPDGKEISLPNSQLTNSSITNFSAEERRRIDMDYSVSYSAKSDEVRQVLLKVAKANELVLEEPAPQVLLQAMADSSVTYRLRVFVKNTDYWNVYYYLTEEGKKALDEAGLEIPFPQVDVHMK